MIASVGVCVASVVLGHGFWGEHVEGNGKKTTESRPVTAEVRRVSIAVPLDVEIREGNQTGLSITIDENLQPLVETRERGDELEIRIRENVSFQGKGRIDLTVTRLASMHAAGSGDVHVVTAPVARNLELATAGSGDVTFEGLADDLLLASSGSGDVQSKGDAGRVELVASGSGTIRHDGGSKSMRASSNGSGGLLLRGSTGSLEVVCSGSGDVQAKDLAAKTAKLELVGSGDVTLTVNGGELSLTLAGSGDVDWWGQASTMNVASVGSGTIQHH